MDRRAFLKRTGAAAGAAAVAALARPAISQAAAARTVRRIPRADLANFDPIWSTAYIARNAALLVWDTLYGVDSELQPQRQMIDSEEVSADGLIWTFRLRPFPKLLLALGKMATPCCFIMPARIAATDPFKQITEYVGSGPMRFVKNEWLPGAKAVFEKFADYVPRQEGAAWLAGGKRILVERVEWVVISDPATAAAAPQSGDV